MANGRGPVQPPPSSPGVIRAIARILQPTPLSRVECDTMEQQQGRARPCPSTAGSVRYAQSSASERDVYAIGPLRTRKGHLQGVL